MIFTGERFIPNMSLDNELEIEHLQRYYSIKEFVKDKIVVDAACGEGYGSLLISETAKQVYGIDISEEAIASAEKKYVKDNLKFIKGSIEKLPIEDKSVDIIVSFETIEHVNCEIQNKFLHEARRVLKEDGILIISTPDKKIYSDQYNYKNEFHIKEFYKNEFIEFLNSEFRFLEIYYQYQEVVSLLNNLKHKDIFKAYSLQKENHDGKYLIILASNKELKEYKEINSIFINNENKYKKMIDRILQLQDEVEERSSWGKALDNEIVNKNIQLRKLNTRLEQSNKSLEQSNKSLEQSNKNLEENNIKLNKKEKELQEALIKYDRMKKILEDTKCEIRNKEAHIELLLESDRELERIKSSRSWRFMSHIWTFRDKVIPQGSKRRLLIKLCVKAIKHPIKFIKKCTPKRIGKFFYYLKREGASNVSSRLDECVIGNSDEKLNLNITNMNENKAYAVSDFKKIVFNKVENPKVSIIIPVYNQIHYTYACLKSILENTNNVSYEIIIANDCSTDITSKIEEFVENINVITSEKNLRFLLNCNNAAKYAKGEYILFLNNDTQVQKNWLSSLVSLIESDKSIGMVGSKLVYPDGRLQEAGGIIWSDASGWNYGRLSDPQDSEYSYVKECDYISGAAMMIRHELWKEIGGFDERFVPAYCEDSDLAFEVRKHGYKVMLQPTSIVVHFEGISNGTDIASGQKSYQVKNTEKFREKWQSELNKQFKNGENVFLARDRSRNKKHVLVIDHYVPQYDKDAGSRTVYQYLKLFVNMGYGVSFIGDNFFRHEPYTTELQQMGIEVLYGSYYSNNWREWIEKNGDYFDFVLLNRPHISVKYMDLLKKNTKAKIVYYGHDLHFLRELREYELTGEQKLLKSSDEWKEKEFDLMNKADVVLYPSEIEVKEIKKINSSLDVRKLPAYIMENNKELLLTKDRKDLLFVGGFAHGPNVDGIVWFCKNIFPKIVQKNPNIKLNIVGSKAPDKVLNLKNSNVNVLGFVSDEELANLYKKCRISIAPLRYGAGIKGKIIEAIANGIPVVTTICGAEGIENDSNFIIVQDDCDRFAQDILDSYDNEILIENNIQKGFEFIEKYYSVNNAEQFVKELFK